MHRATDVPTSSQQRHAAATKQLIARNYTARSGQLQIDGHRISDLVRRYGTPLYVYSQSLLQRAWHELRATYPSPVRILYSMKANPHPAFLRFFLNQGSGIEVASEGEMRAAMLAGANPAEMVFAGPGKTDRELQAAIDENLGEIHAESLGEVQRLANLTAKAGKMARVALRVNPTTAAEGGAAMRMGGRASPFGIDEDQLDKVVHHARSAATLQFVGFHLNSGTQLLDVDSIVAQYEHASRLASQFGQQLGKPLSVVNLGGGLGIPYFPGQQPIDMNHLGAALQSWWSAQQTNPWLRDVQWVIEPGRYLVGEAGIYVTSIVDIKRSRGETFVVLDGGMHHHLAASGNFGQTIKRPFPSAALDRLDQPANCVVTLVGPLCTPLDTLGRNVLLPECRVGDPVGIFQSGAYAITASPLKFLGHQPPVEIWTTPADVTVLSKR